MYEGVNRKNMDAKHHGEEDPPIYNMALQMLSTESYSSRK
jgi:hypothetical protein